MELLEKDKLLDTIPAKQMNESFIDELDPPMIEGNSLGINLLSKRGILTDQSEDVGKKI